ncbi:hypothetical protein TrispH2_009014 [Trichoplax sp. H2]|nr:hypothetical protein TrispH2_009014 [Trichoplax sp. H2]|eukprot:RDD39198.1 hypothetical protein TrispH2_009014 [Trichoplax sp. H2]
MPRAQLRNIVHTIGNWAMGMLAVGHEVLVINPLGLHTSPAVSVQVAMRSVSRYWSAPTQYPIGTLHPNCCPGKRQSCDTSTQPSASYYLVAQIGKVRSKINQLIND